MYRYQKLVEGAKMTMIWESIVNYLVEKKYLYPLAQSRKSSPFRIIKINHDAVTIEFKSGNQLKLEKSRFISAYNMLEENRGSWVSIGARRLNASPDTLEGKIKMEFNGQMNGTSTAPWVAAILVGAFNNIEFNDKLKGQAVRMVR